MAISNSQKDGVPMSEWTKEQAEAGLREPLPEIGCFPNQFEKYRITIVIPEFTAICPRTGLPDFGKVTIHYRPAKLCVELKSLKEYILGYRNSGIFYENAINRILNDFVNACRPVRAEIRGKFRPRGGISTVVSVKYPREE